MQHGSAGVELLQRLLEAHRLERIIGVADGKLRRVCVVRVVGGARVADAVAAGAPGSAALIAESGDVQPREPVGRAFGGGRFEVVHVPRLFLGFDHASPNVLEQPRRQLHALGIRDVVSVEGEVADELVDAVDADR